MQKAIFRYGLYSVVTTIVIMGLTFWTIRGLSFSVQEIFGYISIVLALLFVYFGMRHYRNVVNNGALSFNEGLKIGLLITLFPAFLFGLYSALHVTYIDPGFADRYFQQYIDQVQHSLPPDKAAREIEEMKKYKSLYNNGGFQFGIMFLTVLVIGVVITVISTLILRRKPSPVELEF